jgi:hypothetical protein
MKPADDVQLRHAQVQCLPRLLHDLLDAVLKTVRIPFFSGKRAELATQDAVIGIVDVAINNIAGSIPHLALAHQVGQGTERVEVLALQQAQGLRFGDTHPGRDLLVDVAKLTSL